MEVDYMICANASQAEPSSRQNILRLLLEKGADVNALGGLYGSALQAASKPFYGSVKIIMRDKNEVDNIICANVSQDKPGSRENILRLLLEKGADVNAEGGLYGSALQAAMTLDHTPVNITMKTIMMSTI